MNARTHVIFPPLFSLGGEAIKILYKSVFSLKQNCLLATLSFIFLQILWLIPTGGLFALLGSCAVSSILVIKVFAILYENPKFFVHAWTIGFSRFWSFLRFMLLSSFIVLPLAAIACAFVILVPIDLVGMLIFRDNISSFLKISYIICGAIFILALLPWLWLAQVAIIVDRLSFKNVYIHLSLVVLKNWVRCFGYFLLLYILPLLAIFGAVGYLLSNHFIYLLLTVFIIIAASHVYMAVIQIRLYEVLREGIHQRSALIVK